VGAWSGGRVFGCSCAAPRPSGKFTLYGFGEAEGFAGAPCTCVNGIGSEGSLYVQEMKLWPLGQVPVSGEPAINIVPWEQWDCSRAATEQAMAKQLAG